MLNFNFLAPSLKIVSLKWWWDTLGVYENEEEDVMNETLTTEIFDDTLSRDNSPDDALDTSTPVLR